MDKENEQERRRDTIQTREGRKQRNMYNRSQNDRCSGQGKTYAMRIGSTSTSTADADVAEAVELEVDDMDMGDDACCSDSGCAYLSIRDSQCSHDMSMVEPVLGSERNKSALPGTCCGWCNNTAMSR